MAEIKFIQATPYVVNILESFNQLNGNENGAEDHKADFEIQQQVQTTTTVTGGSQVICQIVSYSDGVYRVKLYQNGLDQASTGTADVYILNLSLMSVLPTGHYILASKDKIHVLLGES